MDSGPKTYRELQKENAFQFDDNWNKELDRVMSLKPSFKTGYDVSTAPQDINAPLADWGESYWDAEAVNEEEFQNLSNARGERQSGLVQLANGVGKFALAAGTSFIDDLVGTAMGLGMGIYNLVDDDPNTGFRQGFVDNPVSRTMEEIMAWGEKNMPNHPTDNELNSPWYSNILSANFIGDKVIKNLGFTVGAIYSGGLVAKGAGALIRAVKSISKAAPTVASATGVIMSSANEARMEALNNKTQSTKQLNQELDQRVESELDKLNQEYISRALPNSAESNQLHIPMSQEEYDSRKAEIYEFQRLSQEKIEQSANDRANGEFIANFGILLLPNAIQFGNMFGRGFKPNIKRSNSIRMKGASITEGVESTLKKPNIAKTLGKNFAAEGFVDEGLQSISGAIFEDYQTTDVNNYFAKALDEDAKQETLSVLNSFNNGIINSLGSGEYYESVFTGGLTGGLMSFGLRKPTSKDGKKRSPIYFRDAEAYKEDKKRDDELVDYINERLKDPKLKELYKGLIKHYSYQKGMDNAILENSELDFKNNEFGQALSDIAMFDNAGLLPELQALYKESYSTDINNLKELIESTTQVKEKTIKGENANGDIGSVQNLELVGPFAKYAHLDKETGKAVADLTEENQAKMSEIIDKVFKENRKTIKQYIKIKDALEFNFGHLFTNDQIQDLVHLTARSENFKDRSNTLVKELLPTLRTLSSQIDVASQKHSKQQQDVMEMIQALEEEEKALNKLISDSEKAAPQHKKGKINKKAKKAEAARLRNLEQNTKILEENKTVKTTYEERKKILEENQKRLAEYKEALLTILDESNTEEQILEALADKKNLKLRLFTEALLNLDTQSKMEGFAQKFKDAVELHNASLHHEVKLKEYLDDIKKLDEDKQKVADDVAEENAEQEKQAIQTEVNNAETPQQVNEIVETANNPEQAQQVVQQAAEDGNPNAQAVVKTKSLNQTIDEEISKLENPQLQEEVVQYLATAMSKLNDPTDLEKLSYLVAFGNAPSEEVRKAAKNIIDVLQANKMNYESVQSNTTTPVAPTTNTTPQPEVIKTEEEKAIEQQTSTTPTVLNKPNVEVPQEESAPINQEEEEHSSEEVKPKVPVETPTTPTPSSNQEVQKKEDVYTPQEQLPEVTEEEVKAENEVTDLNAPKKEFQVPTIPYKHIEATKQGNPNDFVEVNQNPELVKVYDFLYKLRLWELQNSDNLYKPYTTLQKHYNNSIPETVTLEELNDFLKQDNNTKYSIVVSSIYEGSKTKVPGKFKYIYDYLESEGAFDAVDKGLINQGALVSYVIRPEFDKGLSKELGYDTVTIFLKHGDNIIGSLPTQQYADSFEGLSELIKNIEQEYFEWKKNNPEGKEFEFRSQTKVAKIIYGIPTRNSFNSINTLEHKDSNGITFPLGIARNGSITTNNEDLNKKIQYDKQPNKNGFIYILTPLANGNYVPKAVRVNHFSGFDLNDVTTQNLPIIKHIKEEIKPLVSFTSNEPFAAMKIKRELGKYLYIEPLAFFYNSTSNSITLKRVAKDARGNNIIDENGKTKIDGQFKVSFNNKSEEQIVDDILKAIQDLGFNFQIDLKQIQDAQYREDIISSNVLVSNVSSLSNRGSYVLLDYFNEQGELTPMPTKMQSSTKTPTITRAFKKPQTNAAPVSFADQVKARIDANQQRVVEKTDNFYRIQEDDGEIHEYQRVTQVINPEAKDNNFYENYFSAKISKLTSQSKERQEKQLDQIEKDYQITIPKNIRDLSNVKNRQAILELVKNTQLFKDESNAALVKGTQIDTIVRDFFMGNEVKQPELMSNDAYKSIIDRLNQIKDVIQKNGERFFTNNLVLFHKYPDGTRIAGEVDILAVDKNGNFSIYDVKTSKHSFMPTVDEKGNLRDHFNYGYYDPKTRTKSRSPQQNYTNQLSGYKNLFESQYGIPIYNLGIFPFHIPQVPGHPLKIETLIAEKFIEIFYNPQVNVPLDTPGSNTPTQPTLQQQDAQTEDPMDLLNQFNTSDFSKTGLIGTYAGYEVVSVSNIDKTDSGVDIGARTDHVNKRIFINYKVLAEKYKNKAWQNPYEQKDGSKASPVEYLDTTTFQEFLMFTLMHEVSYITMKQNEGESIGQYEDRINKEAELIAGEYAMYYNPFYATINARLADIFGVDENTTEEYIAKEHPEIAQTTKPSLEDDILPDDEDPMDLLNQFNNSDFTKTGLIGTYAGYEIIAVGYIDTTPAGIKIGARADHKNKRIFIDYNTLAEKYKNKAWQNPYQQEDGSKATPVEYLNDASFQEFLMFTLMHEISHINIRPNEGELTGHYEDRINAEAEKITSEYSYFYNPFYAEINAKLTDIFGLDDNSVVDEVKEEKPKIIPPTKPSLEDDILPDDEDSDGAVYTSLKTDTDRKGINIQKELQWLAKVLPNFSQESRVQIISDYIKIANAKKLAEGTYDGEIITLSKLATEGTVYHEAFHVVMNSILSDAEKQEVLKEAREYFGAKDEKDQDIADILYEEDLAEAFRDYTITQQKQGLGNKIIRFFKRLFNLTNSHKELSPYLTNLFNQINQGKYADQNIKKSKLTTLASIHNDDIKYSTISPIQAIKRMNEEFQKSKNILKSINSKRFNTYEDALQAFKNSGIPKEFFYRVTTKNPQGKNIGYKVQLLTTNMFKEKINELSEQFEIMNELNQETFAFDSYAPEIQMDILNAGWTKEQFDLVSQKEKDQAIECAAFF